MSAAEQIRAREELIRKRVRELPDDVRREFFRQSELQLKDPDTYAVLNYLFVAGMHHFYLGNWVRGLINLLVFCSGLGLLFAGYLLFGSLLILTITVIELYALFMSQDIVAEYNNEVMEKICNSLSSPL